MARIEYHDGFFYGLGTWEEKDIFSKAGFTWSPRRRAWITQSQKTAEKVKGVIWTDSALRFVDDRLKVATVSRDLSYAASTDFNPPIPQRLLGDGIDFKPFQKAGIDFSTMPGRRDVLIADPPGLGKTIQAIGVSNTMPRIKQVLVVVPASLKINWMREWKKWCSKGLSVGIAQTQYRETVQDGFYKNGKPRFKKVVHPHWWPNTDVVIINYDILERFSAKINDRAWDLLICDESHALKSPDSGRTIFVLGDRHLDHKSRSRLKKKRAEKEGKKPKEIWFNAIDAKRRVFLSGTPMLNRPIELWPIIAAFDPDGLGADYMDYGHRYCGGWFDPARGKDGAYDFTGATNGEELGRLLRGSFMVRRNKREVLPELPQKFRQVHLLDSPEIRDLVAREDDIAQAMRLYEAQVIRGETEEEMEARQGREIMEQALKFGFDKAYEVNPDKPNARAINLDYAAAVLGLDPPKVAVLFEEIAQVRRELGLAKLSAALPWIKTFLEGDEKLLLFAYHSDVVLALRDALSEFNPAVVYGGTPLLKRQGEVDKFQEIESCRVFIGNIQAAGVGFTLTRAHDVCFVEGDWTPALIEQCEDRACRIGQTAEKIMSFFLVANGSLDCRIAQAAKEKEDNIHLILDT